MDDTPPAVFHIRKTGNTVKWELTDEFGHTWATMGNFPNRAAAEASIEWLKANAATCPSLWHTPA